MKKGMSKGGGCTKGEIGICTPFILWTLQPLFIKELRVDKNRRREGDQDFILKMGRGGGGDTAFHE